jgi:molybdenum cofactor cytidylyltransferase
MLSAILLAAGSSRRMGNINKLLLPYQGSSLLYHTAEQILASGIDELIIVTGHEHTAVTEALHPVTQTLRPLPVTIAHNPNHEDGMTTSIRTGIRIARGDGFMICLSDMVLITPQEYTLLGNAFKEHYATDKSCIIQPAFNGEKGNPVIFSSAYRSAILQHPEKEGCREIVRANTPHRVLINMPTDHVLRDIDSPDEYQSLIHR